MASYRNKNGFMRVQAVQWKGNNANEIDNVLGLELHDYLQDGQHEGKLYIHTANGTDKVEVGNYIAKFFDEYVVLSEDEIKENWEEINNEV